MKLVLYQKVVAILGDARDIMLCEDGCQYYIWDGLKVPEESPLSEFIVLANSERWGTYPPLSTNGCSYYEIGCDPPLSIGVNGVLYDSLSGIETPTPEPVLQGKRLGNTLFLVGKSGRWYHHTITYRQQKWVLDPLSTWAPVSFGS